MTDKEKIIKSLKNALNSLDYTSDLRLVLIRTIEYLQEEPVSEDLDEAAVEYAATGEFLENGKELIDFQAEMAFKTGAKWQKQRLMQDAVERVVKVNAGGYPYIDATGLYDYAADMPLAKAGDKVRIVFIKEG